MDNNQLVDHTYRKHHTWLIQCAYNLTNNKDKAEELVQDLYLRLMEMKDCKRIMYKQDVNLYYLYRMLKSIFLNGLKKQTSTLPLDDDLYNLAAEEYSYSADNEFEERLRLTNECLDEMYWFDAKLLRVYLDEDHSIQSLHNVTGISNSTIWSSLKKTKKYVKEYVKKNM
jgi:RNA polymerase sigma-70 factor (ECF subfamily)